ncbi:hypothetical protein IJC60_00620 [bacterium]|nr:hypothetical protein [bacterium]
MIRKIILFFFMFFALPVSAADNIFVEALEDYSSIKPAKTFKVKLLKPVHTEHISLLEGDILNCTLHKTTKAKRGKRDAQIYFILDSYVDIYGVHKFNQKFLAKYSKSVLNLDSIKSISPKTAIKKTVSTVGDQFLTGVSYGVSFVDGLVTNPEGNRLKSGAKQVYKDSFLSYVEKGENIQVKAGDTFYFVVKVIE